MLKFEFMGADGGGGGGDTGGDIETLSSDMFYASGDGGPDIGYEDDGDIGDDDSGDEYSMVEGDLSGLNATVQSDSLDYQSDVSALDSDNEALDGFIDAGTESDEDDDVPALATDPAPSGLLVSDPTALPSDPLAEGGLFNMANSDSNDASSVSGLVGYSLATAGTGVGSADAGSDDGEAWTDASWSTYGLSPTDAGNGYSDSGNSGSGISSAGYAGYLAGGYAASGDGFGNVGGTSPDLYGQIGATSPTTFNGDGSSLLEPNSAGATSAGTTSDPLLQGMSAYQAANPLGSYAEGEGQTGLSGVNSQVAYSGMPLSGHVGADVEFWNTPDDDLLGGGMPTGSGFDVTTPQFAQNQITGTDAQMVYNSGWMGYGQGENANGLASDPTSIQAAQLAYNAAADSYNSLTGQYDPSLVAQLNDALNTMISNNGFVPAQQEPDPSQAVDLAQVTVNGPSNTSTSSSASSLTSIPFDSGALGINYSDIAPNVSSFTIDPLSPLVTPVNVGDVQVTQQDASGDGIFSNLFNSTDVISAGLSLYSAATTEGLKAVNIVSEETSYLGVQYGLPEVLSDLPVGVGAAFTLGSAYQDYSAGNYAEAGEKAVSLGGAMIGTEVASAAIEAGWISVAVAPVAFPILLPIVAGVITGAVAGYVYHEVTVHMHN